MSDAVTAGAGRLPAPKNLQVEDLLEIYEGVLPDTDTALAEANISGPLNKPNAPSGLEEIILWGPNNDPLPPEDLTEIEGTQLGQVYSFMQNWTNYVQAELTRAKLMLEIQERQNDIVRSALRRYYYEEKKISGTLLDDYVNTDERFVKCDAGALRLRVYHKTAEGRYEQLKRSLNNISREQTRRSDEFEKTLHDERGGRGRSRGEGQARPSFKR